MMNGESGLAAASVAMRSPANQLELVVSSARDGPVLSPGNWLISVSGSLTASPELKSCITGRSSARGNHARLACLADGCSPPLFST